MDTHSPTEFTPETAPHPLPSIQKKSVASRSYLTYGVITIAVVVTAIGVLFFVAKNSLPGEPLYRVKTEGIEQVQLFIKHSASSRAAYNNILLETRLSELQTLSESTDGTNPALLTQIATRATSHVNDTVAVLDKSTLSFEDKIRLLVPLSDLTRTMEVLVDRDEELSSIKTIIGDNDGIANEALESTLTAFAETGPVERVFAMIQSETQILAEQSTKVAFGSTAQKTIARRAEDTADALRENNFKDALSYILKAQQAIIVDEFLFDAERGPIDGVPIEPGAMPEGS